ncbi:hypothetical protein [Bacillus atrophaeus]|uniref:hypothetical protein n=1 Tax=Bacillus atrophaeus TaxID=1452 RepID=UPI00255B5E80|nr:hypothetical protein [Bacillus atrophaeus]MDL5141713.1 hypothetical protein [Bacillus atrophaeus]MEC0694843.1 hypothetical protein [Bacillus atrophaeus]
MQHNKHKVQQLAAALWSAHIQEKLGEWVLTANFGVTNCGAKRHRGKESGKPACQSLNRLVKGQWRYT